ncbi:MAG: FtsQ-type POTRA domain-containing protein, partial [Candidatus Eisenbacteria bacterium]|nr:FtsQ-type POTRA domain-containing protein [Candidatus Eisenbacteria bacterium]
ACGIGVVLTFAPGWGKGAEEFRIREVDVRGAVVLTPGEVKQLCGVTEGESLLSLDVTEVEEAAAGSPRVARAQATRLLPDRVLIRLVEKEPLALVKTANGLIEVAGDLMVLPPASRTPLVDLPVVTGADCELSEGERVEDPELASVIELLGRARAVSRELWMEMSEIRIAPGSGLVIYTVADGAEIRVGSGALDEDGLERLAMVLRDIELSGLEAESIDLRFREQAVVRFESGAAGGRV